VPHHRTFFGADESATRMPFGVLRCPQKAKDGGVAKKQDEGRDEVCICKICTHALALSMSFAEMTEPFVDPHPDLDTFRTRLRQKQPKDYSAKAFWTSPLAKPGRMIISKIQKRTLWQNQSLRGLRSSDSEARLAMVFQ
jgi:hypothetical protein